VTPVAKKAPILLAPIPEPKVPISVAADTLACICDMIDSGEADPRKAVTLTLFEDAKGGLSRSVDEAIAFKAFLEGALETAKRIKGGWEKKRKQLEQVLEAFHSELERSMTAHPDIPFGGTIGRFTLANNPPGVELAWGDKTLTKDVIEFFNIDKSYVREKVSYEIDKAALARDLKAGVDVPWAKLKRTKRVDVN
jgi:hypothetical protein